MLLIDIETGVFNDVAVLIGLLLPAIAQRNPAEILPLNGHLVNKPVDRAPMGIDSDLATLPFYPGK